MTVHAQEPYLKCCHHFHTPTRTSTTFKKVVNPRKSIPNTFATAIPRPSGGLPIQQDPALLGLHRPQAETDRHRVQLPPLGPEGCGDPVQHGTAGPPAARHRPARRAQAAVLRGGAGQGQGDTWAWWTWGGGAPRPGPRPLDLAPARRASQLGRPWTRSKTPGARGEGSENHSPAASTSSWRRGRATTDWM